MRNPLKTKSVAVFHPLAVLPNRDISHLPLGDLDSMTDVDEMIAVLLGAEYEPILVGQRRGRHRRNYAAAIVYFLWILSERERRDRKHIRGHGGATRSGYLVVDSASDGHDFREHLQFAGERQNEQLHAVSSRLTMRLISRRRCVVHIIFPYVPCQFSQSIARIAGITASRRTLVGRRGVGRDIRARPQLLLRLRAGLGAGSHRNSQGTRHGFKQVQGQEGSQTATC